MLGRISFVIQGRKASFPASVRAEVVNHPEPQTPPGEQLHMMSIVSEVSRVSRMWMLLRKTRRASVKGRRRLLK